ncbi:MAG TPA: hypothetical protein VK783_14985 [Bacteroidia bacterium]|nr:hypothetical protein [Bacteroidia bacterium]
MMKTLNDTETLKENLNAATEKTAEMVKSFVETSTKQFEASLLAGKTMFDTITKQFPKTNSVEKQAEHIKDTIEDTMKATTKWFEESSKVVTGFYDKQYKSVLDSYTNFMGLAFEGFKTGKESEIVTSFKSQVNTFLKNIEDSSAVMKKMFSTIIDNLTDSTEKGYVKEISDLMQDTYSKQAEQLLKFNKNLLSAENLQSSIAMNKEISEKLQKDLERNFEASKKIIKSISDSYTKENNFTTKSGKKMLEEILAEIDVVTKNNMKFWTNWFNEVYTENKTNGTKTNSKNGQKA